MIPTPTDLFRSLRDLLLIVLKALMSSTDHSTTPPPPPPKPPVQLPSPPVPTPTPPRATLTNFCLAIRDYEGKPGDRSYRNNNPGNCRFSHVGYMPIYEPVKQDKDSFAIFKDYATGWLYLQNLVKAKIHLHPNQTILQFMEEYSPSSDGNDPTLYAKYIAAHLGVDYNAFPMRLLVLT